MPARKQHETTPSQRRSRRSLVISSLLLAAILFLVIAFVTFRQLRAAEANRMRLLAGFTGQVEATVLDLVQRYVNVVDQVPLTVGATAGAESGRDLVTDRIRASLEDVPNVSLVEGPTASEGTRQRLTVEVRGPRIYLRYSGPDRLVDQSGLETPAESGGQTGASGTAAYLGLLDLTGMVRPMVLPEAFDLVVLARRTPPRADAGVSTAEEPFTVLFQQGAGELKLADARAAWEVRAPGVWRSLQEAWSEGSDPAPTGGGTRVVETRIAGTDYRVFVQPVTLHLRDTEGRVLGPSEEWLACGLISWENLLSSSFTTSPAILFLMVVLIPLMLVAWPFLKMALITRRQPFTRFDAAFLVLSSLVGLSLATLLTLDALFLTKLEATVDDQLDLLGRRLRCQLSAELDDTADDLRGVRDDDGDLRKHAPQLLAAMESASREGLGPSLGDEEREAVRRAVAYPFLHALFWANDTGYQADKVPFHRDSVLRNRVNKRGYFRCPREPDAPELLAGEGLTAVLDPDPPAGCPAPEKERTDERPVCVQSIRSKTTAGDLAVLSAAAGGRGAPDGIIALTTRLVSLNRALLAPGFSFAVVNRAGIVAFHSDSRRNVNENFLKATGDDPVLAALLVEEREGPLDLHYWGSRYRARVLPLQRLPWSLITLRTTRDLRTRNFELIYDFLNPFLLYAAGLGFTLFICIRFLPHTALRRLLPSRRFTPVYRSLVLCSPMAVGLFAVLLALHGPPLVFLAAFVPPVLFLIVAVLSFQRVERDLDRPPPQEASESERGTTRSRLGTLVREGGLREGVILSAGVLAAGPAALAGGFDALGWVLLVTAAALTAAFVRLRRAFTDQRSVVPYTAALAVALLTFAVLPSAALFRVAESRQSQLLVQDAEVGLLRQQRSRLAGLVEDRGDLWDRIPEPPLYAERIAELADGTADSFFAAELIRRADDEDQEPGERELDEPGAWLWPYGRGSEGGNGGRLIRLASRLLSSRPFPLNDLTAEPLGTDLSRFRHHGVGWALVESRPPAGGGTAEVARPGRWLRARWTDPPALDPLGYRPAAAVRVPFDGRPLTGQVPPLRVLLLSLAALALGALVAGSALFIARKVALADLAPNRKHAAIDRLLEQVCYNGRRAQRYLVRTSLPAAVVQMARGATFNERIHVLEFGKLWSADIKEREAAFFGPLNQELREARRMGRLRRGRLPDDFRPRALLIADFRPDLAELEETDARIDLLRRLERHGLPADLPDWRGRSVLIVTSRPYHLLTRSSGTGADLADEAEAKSRWHAYFARFGQRHARDEGKIQMFVSWIEWQRACLAAGRWPALAPSKEGRSARAFLEPDWFFNVDGKVWSARSDDEVLPACRRVFDDPRGLEPRAGPASDRSGGRRRVDPRKRQLRRLLEVVRDECVWTWRLQRVGIDILRELQEGLRLDLESESGETAGRAPASRPWEPPTRHQLVNRIGLAAQPYYERVWDGCEEEEKRVLYQLARHGVVNPKAFDVVLDLLNKGLVVRTSENPTLRLVNRSFAHFVRRTVRRSEVWRWEEEEGLSAWEIWKWVLPIPLLLLGAFLFMTQQDALSNVVGLVVALASLVPTGVNLYQHFQHLAAEREAAGA